MEPGRTEAENAALQARLDAARVALEAERSLRTEQRFTQISQLLTDVRLAQDHQQQRIAEDFRNGMAAMREVLTKNIEISSTQLVNQFRDEGRKQAEQLLQHIEKQTGDLRKQIEPLTNWRYYVAGAVVVLGTVALLVWQVLLPWLAKAIQGAAVTGAKP